MYRKSLQINLKILPIKTICLLMLSMFCIMLYSGLTYWVHRSNFGILLAGWVLLWGGFVVLYLQPPTAIFSIKKWILVGIIFRACLLFALPNLSDDFYRFVWDGHLYMAGLNPFSCTPTAIINDQCNTVLNYSDNASSAWLYARLNSPHYYTIYPPVCQTIFFLSVYLGGTGLHSFELTVFFLKLFILLFEIGTLGLLWKLGKLFHVYSNAILGYALNPLVILETVGNLHFEAAMVFFTLLFLYGICKIKTTISPKYASKGKVVFKMYFYYILSAIGLTLAICSKLLPMLFVPFLYRRMGIKVFIGYMAMVLALIGICFAPFLSGQVWQAIWKSGGLYFQRFEFNASIYYLVRGVGYWIWGYNIIAWAGKFLAVGIVGSILVLAIYEHKPTAKNLPIILLWALSIYFLAAPIVHPWYIVPLVALSILTPYRYPLVWSAMVMLSYHAYRSTPLVENGLWVAVSYVCVLLYMIWELCFLPKKPIGL